MKKNNSKYLLYVLALFVVGGVLYAACKDVTPQQERKEISVELKLSK